MAWLPIALRLDGLRCVVIGGGIVAERKVTALLNAFGEAGRDEERFGTVDEQQGKLADKARFGAPAPNRTGILSSQQPDIMVISPELTPTLLGWTGQGQISWLEREYAEGDLAGASLVFAATNRREANERIAEEARRQGCLVSIADDPEKSGFALPSVVRRGKLTLAVSTDGASPALARRIRLELEERYGQEYEAWLDLLAEVRIAVRERISDTALRQELHRELERWDVPALLRRKGDGSPTLITELAALRTALLETLRRDPTPAALQRLRGELGLAAR